MRITSCLLCENIHNEGNGKVSLLGFIGILPDISFMVKDVHLPIPRFLFLFSCRDGNGSYRIVPSLIGPDGVAVRNIPTEVLVEFPPGGQVGAGFGLQNAVLGHYGVYTVLLSCNGQELYRSTFEVMPIPPQGIREGQFIERYNTAAP